MNPYEISNSVPTESQESKESNKMEGKACKRAHDSSDCDSKDSSTSAPAEKLPKLENGANVDDQVHPGPASGVSIPTISLLSLSDDVLLHIFGYLDSVTLTRLNRTCQRLKNICSDSTLWTKFDTNGLPLTVKELRTMLKYFNKRTTSITVHGFLKIRSKMHHESITKATLDSISEKCSNLQELKLKDCFIDAQNVNVSCLPTSLTTLSIANCEVVNMPPRQSYFFELHKRIPLLEKLDLSYNNWLTNHSIQSLCKCSDLKEVNFRGCTRIGEVLAYTALATRYGFRNVCKIDLRDTSIGDHELSCFGKLPKLTHLSVGHSIPTSEYVPPHGSEGDGRLTDRGVFSLVPRDGETQESKLKFLDLTNTLITDRSLVDLSSSSMSLSHLIVRGTKVTIMGCMNFSAAKPNCILDHDENEKHSSPTIHNLTGNNEGKLLINHEEHPWWNYGK